MLPLWGWDNQRIDEREHPGGRACLIAGGCLDALALFDANVLYPAPMRNALMQLAVTDLFKAKWTAAIVGRCDAIVTQNLKDFPPEALAPFGIETQHPNDFFRNQLSLAPGLVCSALRKVRARLKNPPKSVDEYLSILTQQGLVATVADLEQFADLL